MKQNPEPRGLQLYILLCKAVNQAARFLDVEPLWFATAAVAGAAKRGFSHVRIYPQPNTNIYIYASKVKKVQSVGPQVGFRV